jgi:hypothetical protein
MSGKKPGRLMTLSGRGADSAISGTAKSHVLARGAAPNAFVITTPEPAAGLFGARAAMILLPITAASRKSI